MMETVLIYQTLFFHVITIISCAFSPVTSKSLHATFIRICTSGGDPLFHSCCDSVVARKMSMQCIFHQSKQMEVRRCLIQTVKQML